MRLAEGETAPNFKLPGTDGKEHSLSDFKGKYIVLYFYPKDDTPGCTKEACNFRDSIAKIKKLGAEVVGISADSIDSHNKFGKKYDLNFLLLSDPKKRVISAYNAWGKKNIFGNVGLGIIRSTFVIDRHGKVAKVISPVKVEGHDQEIIEFLRSSAK